MSTARFVLMVLLLSISQIQKVSAAANCATIALPGCDFVETLRADAETFAKRVTGGQNRPIIWVKNLNDSGAGSLRDAIAQTTTGSWIRFEQSGSIMLKSPLRLKTNMTIDGRDKAVKLKNYGLMMMDVKNVIVTDIEISDVDPSASQSVREEQDAIQISSNLFKGPIESGYNPAIKLGSSKIWINHVLLSNFGDGLLDATRGVREFTLSHSILQNHNKGMLLGLDISDIGAAESGGTYAVHHTIFRNIRQRNPRLTQGKLLFYNNHLENFGDYGIASVDGGEVEAINNVFSRNVSGANYGTKALINHIYNEPHNYGRISESGNLYLGQATSPRYNDSVYKLALARSIAPATSTLVTLLNQNSGPRAGRVPFVSSSDLGKLQVPLFNNTWLTEGGSLTITSNANSRGATTVARYALTEDSSFGSHRFIHYGSVTTGKTYWQFSAKVEAADVGGLRIYILNTDDQANQMAAASFIIGSAPSVRTQWMGALTKKHSFGITKLESGGYQIYGYVKFPADVHKIRFIVNGESDRGSTTYTGVPGRRINLSDVRVEPIY